MLLLSMLLVLKADPWMGMITYTAQGYDAKSIKGQQVGLVILKNGQDNNIKHFRKNWITYDDYVKHIHVELTKQFKKRKVNAVSIHLTEDQKDLFREQYRQGTKTSKAVTALMQSFAKEYQVDRFIVIGAWEYEIREARNVSRTFSGQDNNYSLNTQRDKSTTLSIQTDKFQLVLYGSILDADATPLFAGYAGKSADAKAFNRQAAFNKATRTSLAQFTKMFTGAAVPKSVGNRIIIEQTDNQN